MLFRNNTRDLMRNRGRRMRLTEESYPNGSGYDLDQFDSIADICGELRTLIRTDDHDAIVALDKAIIDKYGRGGQKALNAYYHNKGGILDLNFGVTNLWAREAEGAIEFLRDFGVKKFALSGNSTANNELSWEFIQNGCKLKGMELIDDKPAFMFDIMN